jgi:hypothetical protein
MKFFSLMDKIITEEAYWINYRTGARAGYLNYILKMYKLFDLTHFPFGRQSCRISCEFSVNVKPMPKNIPVPGHFINNSISCYCSLDNWAIICIDTATGDSPWESGEVDVPTGSINVSSELLIQVQR